MGYSAETIRRVSKHLQDARQNAILTAERRRVQVAALDARIAEIDTQLGGMGPEICLAALAGKEERIAALKEKNLALQQERRARIVALGFPEDYTDLRFACARCGDTGYTDDGMCGCMRKLLVAEGFASSGLGSLLERQSFDNFYLHFYGDRQAEIERILSVARAFAEDFDKTHANLLFVGGTGLGKTHLSTAIARRAIEREMDVVYETAQNIIADFQYDRFEREHGAEPKCEKYFSCDLLIIDDLGAELSNQFTVSALYNIINTRINSGKSMIINTNLGQKNLLERYDERITSRLLGEFYTFLFRGTDIRKQK